MYSASELCGTDSKVYMANQITRQADIWSFKCVLIDCGVLTTLHERGRSEFRRQRAEEPVKSMGAP